MSNRRQFLQRAFGVSAGMIAASPALLHAQHEQHSPQAAPRAVPKATTGTLPSVQTPDVPHLPFKLDNGVKVFHLIAEPVKQTIFPGRTLDVWGYNGSAPGPTIQVNQGDRVRVIVDNHLPEATSMHWHGFEIPVKEDGMPYISQPPIAPGGRYVYEFTLRQNGTFFYHSHNSMQQMMGMIGMFIMHPPRAFAPKVDRDFGFILQEYGVLPNNTVPNSMSMEFNWLTINGKSAPATTPVLCKLGERVRMRWVNLGMDHHPIHLHGHTFTVTGTEAGRQDETTWQRKNTVLVGVAEAVDFEFVADNPGDWMIHCHLPHHMMNNMASMIGPMTSGSGAGMAGAASMNTGMGMATQGHATSEEYAPALSRGASAMTPGEQRAGNSPLTPQQATQQQQHGSHAGVLHNAGTVSPNANAVPGFPQDAFMEMQMDDAVKKPETHGLAPGWSASMMGMMTLVRVLQPEMFDRITQLQKQGPQTPAKEHNHGL
ncbi:MAG: multicopper oxidase domain-containing protein [Terriglobales bacterium]